MRYKSLSILVFVGVFLAACNSSGESVASGGGSSTTATESQVLGLIAIGHSSMTGENSDPENPGMDAKENSWATGTAPEVNSIYQRLIAIRPEYAGHVANYGQGEAVAQILGVQAERALSEVPMPALVLIQTIDTTYGVTELTRHTSLNLEIGWLKLSA